jgi:uncharacterized protein (DUF924 family)
MFRDVLTFWFDELEPKQWWIKDVAFDAQIAQRFGTVHRSAAVGELFSWRDTSEGRLAEIIVLDQFSRNIYRDAPGAFASDGMALALAQEAIRAGASATLSGIQGAFLLMPYMHSESQVVHEEAVKHFTELGLENQLNYELKHKEIIDQFGRYPHRNAILGRTSTPEEEAFLKQPGSSF